MAVDRSAQLEAAPIAVGVRDVSKTFRIPRRQYSTLKERVLHPLQSREHDELHALSEVSAEIRAGEFFGIVGRNGSGKSTLLKCLAGIYGVDRGTIEVHGRLSPFIELGVGFNMDLTARENVIINAIMLGLTRREARARFDEIIAFAELEEFLDLKLKNYSSGMSVRLAFSVAVQADADVLLVDEVLAVGDAAFQQKCFDQFQRMKDEGKTIVFVTHDMGAVQRFCDRAMLIERGRVVELGAPSRISRAYNELNFGRLAHDTQEGERGGDHLAAEITDGWFENGAGERVATLGQGEEIRMAFEVRFTAPLEDPIFGFTLRNDVGHTVFATSTAWDEPDTGRFEPGDRVVLRCSFDNVLATVRHTLTPSIARAGSGADAVDIREDLATVLIHGARTTGSLVDLPHVISLDRALTTLDTP